MVAMPLLAIIPATAQAAGNDAGGYAVTAARNGVPAADRQRARDPDQAPGADRPQRFVSLLAAPDLDVGVGMFSVIGSTEKEMVRRRIEPLTDVRARDSRVAAVGLSLRF